VDLTVVPAGRLAQAHGPAGSPITVQPPVPNGSGPFTYRLVSSTLPPSADGTVSIDARTGAVTFTPASRFVGAVTLGYTVTDAAGVTSAPANVTFDVEAVSATPAPAPPAPAAPAPEAGAMIPLRRGGLLIVAGLLVLGAAVLRRRPAGGDAGPDTGSRA
jgi:hypothetical protein